MFAARWSRSAESYQHVGWLVASIPAYPQPVVQLLGEMRLCRRPHRWSVALKFGAC